MKKFLLAIAFLGLSSPVAAQFISGPAGVHPWKTLGTTTYIDNRTVELRTGSHFQIEIGTGSFCFSDAHIGRVAVSTFATSGEWIYICEGAGGWVAQAGGGVLGSSETIRVEQAGSLAVVTSTMNYLAPLTAVNNSDEADIGVDPSSVTLQGNVFNGADQLVQANSSSYVPNANIDPSSVTKLGPTITESEITFNTNDGTRHDHTVADVNDINAGTDITADLEEETHASEHQDGGGDELNVDALSGQLADIQLVNISTGGTLIQVSSGINVVAGTNVTISGAYDASDGEVDITINSQASAGTGIWVEDGGSSVIQTSTMDFTGGQFVVTDNSGEALVALDQSSVTILGTDGYVPNSLLDPSSVTKLGASITENELTFNTNDGSRHDHVDADLTNVNAGTDLTADLEEETHASEHENGGADEISVAGLSGELADAQTVTISTGGTSLGDFNQVDFAEGSNVTITPTVYSSSVSLSIASSGGSTDDLGNHVATTTLDMAGFDISNVSTITTSSGRSYVNFSTSARFSESVYDGNESEGVNGQVLTSNGSGSAPTWQTSSGGASTLAVTTGTQSGFFTHVESSPTAVVNFDSDQFSTELTGTATAYVRSTLNEQIGQTMDIVYYSNVDDTSMSDNQYVGLGAYDQGWDPWCENVSQFMEVAGTMQDLRVQMHISSATRTYTVMKNCVETELACTITTPESACEDLQDVVRFDKGDYVALKHSISSSMGNVFVNWSVRYTANSPNKQPLPFNSGSAALNNASVRYMGIFGESVPGGTENQHYFVIPTTGTISNLHMMFGVGSGSPQGPGAGKSYAVVLRKNGSDTDLQSTVSGTNYEIRETTTSISVVPGDYVNFKITPSGSPTTLKVIRGGLVFTAETDGEFIARSNANGNLSTTSTDYYGIGASAGSYEVGESTFQLPTPQIQFQRMYVLSSADPAGGTYTYTLRENGVDTSLTCDQNGGSTTCNSITDVNIDAGTLLTIEAAPSGSPTAGAPSIGFSARVIDIPVHASTHENGGSDEISVEGLSGLLADAQKIEISTDDVQVGISTSVNFVAGSGMTITAAQSNSVSTITFVSSAGSPGGASGNVQYNDGAGGFEGESSFHYDTSNNRLGVNQASPETIFHVTATGLGSDSEAGIIEGPVGTGENDILKLRNTTAVSSNNRINLGFYANDVFQMTDMGRIYVTVLDTGANEDSSMTFEVQENGTGTSYLDLDGNANESKFENAHLRLADALEFRFGDSDDSNYVGFSASATLSGNQIWILPDADGTNGQVIQTDGSGNLSFATIGTGGGYDLEPATVTIQAHEGIEISTISGKSGMDTVHVSTNLSLGQDFFWDGTSTSDAAHYFFESGGAKNAIFNAQQNGSGVFTIKTTNFANAFEVDFLNDKVQFDSPVDIFDDAQLNIYDDSNQRPIVIRSSATNVHGTEYSLPDSTGTVNQVLGIKAIHTNHVDLEWQDDDTGGSDLIVQDDTVEIDAAVSTMNFTTHLLSTQSASGNVAVYVDTTTLASETMTLTNKTIDADNNTVSNIGSVEITDGDLVDADMANDALDADKIVGDSTDDDDLDVGAGGTGVSTLTDGGVLLGSGSGDITAMSVLADGSLIVGDGTTDPVALAAFTNSTGDLTHEAGGLEADVSAFTGLLAVSGGATSEVDAKSELETQIADVADFAEADGDTFTGNHDFGGASFLEIPNGTNPTADDPGEVAHDTTDDQLILDDYVVAVATKSFSVSISSPSSGDWNSNTIPIGNPFRYAVTVAEVNACVLGTSTPSLDFNIEERALASLNSAGTDMFSADQTADADCIEITSFSNAGWAADAHWVVTTGAAADSGDIEYLTVQVYYTVDRQ